MGGAHDGIAVIGRVNNGGGFAGSGAWAVSVPAIGLLRGGHDAAGGPEYGGATGVL